MQGHLQFRRKEVYLRPLKRGLGGEVGKGLITNHISLGTTRSRISESMAVTKERSPDQNTFE